MSIYRSHGMSLEQKEKIKEYDKKKAAARWLKLKREREVKREMATSRKCKSRVKFKISKSPTKYAKLVSKVVKVAEGDSVKSNILITSLEAHKVSNFYSSKPLSVLELQAPKNKNRIQEDSALVQKFKDYYGSLRKLAMH